MDILEVAKKTTAENREENYEIHFRNVKFFMDLVLTLRSELAPYSFCNFGGIILHYLIIIHTLKVL